MIFTDLPAAIEEARYQRHKTDRPFAVVQRHMGFMQVRTERWAIKHQMMVVYSTRHDKTHTVLLGIK